MSNPYESPRAFDDDPEKRDSQAAPLRSWSLRGTAVRFVCASLSAVAAVGIVYLAFCLFWPYFRPVKLVKDMGFWNASDRIAFHIIGPIIFLVPALLVPVVAPIWSRIRLAGIVLYSVLAIPGVAVVIVLSMRAYRTMTPPGDFPNEYTGEVGEWWFLSIASIAVVVIGLFLCCRWLLGKGRESSQLKREGESEKAEWYKLILSVPLVSLGLIVFAQGDELMLLGAIPFIVGCIIVLTDLPTKVIAAKRKQVGKGVRNRL